MFGQNAQVPQKLTDGLRLDVVEVFDTIQGEGPWGGLPSCFIRLQFCNLACHFCDTEFETGTKWTVEHLVEAAKKLKRVVLTGGEPLRQNILPLLARLRDEGIPAQVETAGTLWIPGLETFVESGWLTIVCSPKTPKVHAKIQEYCRDWKYIVRKNELNRRTGLPGASTQKPGVAQNLFSARALRRKDPDHTIWVQPMDELDAVKNRANMELATKVAMEHDYRLSLQQHKILGVR